MYLSSLQGQATSASPSASGCPTECSAGTKSPSSPIRSRAAAPMRVMIRMDTTTYGESVSSTPSCEMREPSGPMENGTTYIVRPFIEPANFSFSVARMATGSAQLLVGPASSSCSEQMKVRSSTRATSLGLERARNELGRVVSLRRVKVPPSTSSEVRRSHSSSEPSAHSTRSGWASTAISSTHSRSFLLRVGGFSRPGIVDMTAVSYRQSGFASKSVVRMPLRQALTPTWKRLPAGL